MIILLFTYNNCAAWNALGHRIIAQIAYDQLHINTNISCINAAVWLDRLYGKKYQQLHGLHYIDLPFSLDKSTILPPRSPNAVTAINHAYNSLLSKNITDHDYWMQLRILLHVVGDLHQPLHAITQFSKKFPYGDNGGNLVLLPYNNIGKNLHAYWDNGGGLLLSNNKNNIVYIKKMAKAIIKHWPCQKFLSVQKFACSQINPEHWARESFVIAKNQAYIITPYWPNRYQEIVSKTSERQLALAGCRLAVILFCTKGIHEYINS